ncbi:MAG: acyl-CoA dehydrogenase [Pseudomonadota bacterium]
MANKFFSMRNLKFMLYEVFDAESLTQYEYYGAHHDKMSFDLMLNAAEKIAKVRLWPLFEEMDRKPPQFIDGTIKVHPSIRKIMRECGEGGWISSVVPHELDGMQLPQMIATACKFIFVAANYSAAAYMGLTEGAASLIESFGTKMLYERYVPNMHAGNWQGTMALTEPEAGSSLADLVSTAQPTENEYYLIKGQKIFISGGDSDAVDNVVHLMLARIKGAPAGVKGISLFVVPKKRVEEDGSLVPNDVTTSGVFHKLGYRGCPIAWLTFGDEGDCRGWLVGEPHNGLRYMFKMMNEARIEVGMGATGMATAAYYAALEYCKERAQGRKTGQKNSELPPVLIIEHADVKRMLLFQRAIAEGALSLIIQCSKYVDLQKMTDGEEKEKYSLLLDLLTPIVKSYASEMAIQSISQGIQCLGGSGFCQDYPLEQYYRDCRIHPIHEGTTAIQGMDLLGRKILMKEGKAYEGYLVEVRQAIQQAKEYPELFPYAGKLADAVEKLESLTGYLQQVLREKGVEIYLADATLYLEYFGIICIAWQWLLQGISIRKALAQECTGMDRLFYQGKFATMQFFYEYELPKTLGLEECLRKADCLTVSIDSSVFDD